MKRFGCNKKMVYEESACGSHRLKWSSLAAIFALENEHPWFGRTWNVENELQIPKQVIQFCLISVCFRPPFRCTSTWSEDVCDIKTA